ncbi:hypothetical protein [Testudinibacter aquarius]|uniref:Transferrin-binding protein B C-lobe/N-lobe beta barrel domain-containing protein n=1 Tax=Testudinibacter aquarius TaxID=1524974 RepID=A0A4R3Y807_9PAST|nr:hypothetical protein [Testudinibacter aquarius]KAE9530228.1 hypothetical protein A1D24_07105 [Testudinibacter aquarius]TCV88017.1 hypothetical protein EDC16_104207 [Testudinibacter aquarius]
MKITYKTTAMVCLLSLFTAACSSNSSSFTEEKPNTTTEAPKSEEPKSEEPKPEEPKSEEPKPEEPKPEEPKPEEPKSEEPKPEEPKSEEPKSEEPKSEEPRFKDGTLEDRTLNVVVSSQGGERYEAVLETDKNRGFYMSGPMDFRDSKGNILDLRNEFKDKTVMNNYDVDPNKVQELVITSENGEELGKFRFINQTYSSYGTFSPELTAPAAGGDPAHPFKNHENLGTYILQPTTETQFDQLAQASTANGIITYRGHSLGYKGGPKGGTPTEGYMGDVSFQVNIASKTISGEMSARQDSFVRHNWRFTDDDNNPTAEGIAFDQPNVKLILSEANIVANNNKTMGFKNGEVRLLHNGQQVRVNDYAGTFAGPEANEIVGQIGGGEERIMFGATKQE